MTDINTIRDILIEAAPEAPEEITPDTNLVRDLQLDSFGLMDVVLKFEEVFNISIPDRDLRQFTTVQDILDYLNDKNMCV